MNNIQIAGLLIILVWCLYLGYKLIKFENEQEQRQKNYKGLLKQIKLKGRIDDHDLKTYRYIGIYNWYLERLITKNNRIMKGWNKIEDLPKKSIDKVLVKICAKNCGKDEIWEEEMEFTYLQGKSYFSELDTGVLYCEEDKFCQFAECWNGEEEYWETDDDTKITHWKLKED